MKLLFKLLILLFSIVNCAQSNESISEQEFLELHEKTKIFINSNIDSAFFFISKIEKSNSHVHKAFALATKSYAFAKQNKFAHAEKNYLLAIQLITKEPKSLLKDEAESYIYNVSGLVDWMNNKLPNALDKFFIAKKIAISIKDIVQTNKINQNIANVKRDIGNYKEAIVNYRESDKIVNTHKALYSNFDYLQNKTNINYNLGICYEGYFSKNRHKKNLLDSAYIYYKKALLYSKDNITININSLKNIGNIQFFRQDFLNAEKSYIAVASLAKENNAINEYYGCMYNLGLVNYTKKKYKVALIYFSKVDSIYKLSNIGKLEFIDSNYKLAKIFEINKDFEKALYHSKVYIENFETNEKSLNDNIVESNFKLNNQDLKKEMIDLQKKYSNRVLFKNIFLGSLIALLFILIILYIRKDRSKKIIERKIELILNEFKSFTNNNNVEVASDAYIEKKDTILISLDNENEILTKLKVLEEKKYYLKPDFTQQMVAKKIKTNTTYLSYVVNKHFGKSFSVYHNELRINFTINEIINNTKFREYTTLAIAESAGFKNADSFSTSFKKKTGLTPFQFINEIKKKGI